MMVMIMIFLLKSLSLYSRMSCTYVSTQNNPQNDRSIDESLEFLGNYSECSV
jgi:hypothetical protein